MNLGSIQRLVSAPTIRTISGLAGGNLLATAIAVIGTLVQAQFILPADLGYFRSFSIVTGYLYFFHLGLFGALQRYYPYYIGRGEHSKALAVAEICQAWNVVVSALLSGAFIILGVWALGEGNWRAMLGWFVQAVAVAVFIYGGYLGATYRSGHDFATVAKGSVFSSVANLFTLPFFLLWSYVALALRSSVGNFVSLVYLHIRRPLKLQWRFTWREWFGLLKEGVPIFVANYGASTGWSVVETSMILSFLGDKALGLWSMSFLVLEAANKIAQAITAVYIPRVTELYGRTGSVRACLHLCRKPMLWGTPLMVLMAAGCCVVLTFLVPLLMSKYSEGLPIMCIMMLALPIIVLELPYSLLVAMGKIVQQNIAVYIGLGCFVLVAFLFVRAGMGLKGVVGASLIGRTSSLLTTYMFIYSARRNEIA